MDSQLTEKGPLVVIGAGFGRTGTMSLKFALETLLRQPCYHMYEVAMNHTEHIAQWLELFDLIKRDPTNELVEEKVKSIFKGYRAATDHPTCSIYEQLLKIYPESKIILTTRDKNQWLNSARATILPRKPTIFHELLWRLIMNLNFGRNFAQLATTTLQRNLGDEVDMNDDHQVLLGFEQWNERVKSIVPPERLLVFEIKQGWEPLCNFLELPVPDIPFPHVNDREEFTRRMDKVKSKMQGVCIIGLCIVVALISAYALR